MASTDLLVLVDKPGFKAMLSSCDVFLLLGERSRSIRLLFAEHPSVEVLKDLRSFAEKFNLKFEEVSGTEWLLFANPCYGFENIVGEVTAIFTSHELDFKTEYLASNADVLVH